MGLALAYGTLSRLDTVLRTPAPHTAVALGRQALFLVFTAIMAVEAEALLNRRRWAPHVGWAFVVALWLTGITDPLVELDHGILDVIGSLVLTAGLLSIPLSYITKRTRELHGPIHTPPRPVSR